MSSRIITFATELYGSRNVLSQLVAQQLILRYRRTALGYLWTLLNPLLMMRFTLVSKIFSHAIINYIDGGLPSASESPRYIFLASHTQR
jgi:ABC-type polysaccharide/polyol phosphate export permease